MVFGPNSNFLTKKLFKNPIITFRSLVGIVKTYGEKKKQDVLNKSK